MMIGTMMRAKMTMTNGETSNFSDIYNRQIGFQRELILSGEYGDLNMSESLPSDSVEAVSYHVNHLICEIGELLKADTRWKSSHKLDVGNKKEELADCFIELINIAIFSEINCDDLLRQIYNKQELNLAKYVLKK
jgi:NTP pyrophosphatase (non-canonical NTP hydrolase)